ncbi:hypothetical protein GCM10009801_26850 [Streptomyces albiaxialis]|uniref:Uncharacterized protein n=1 Tax=Streptomyces albiaxialis TaxID=329523 RepID=A0ABN2VVD9_9ACTN
MPNALETALNVLISLTLLALLLGPEIVGHLRERRIDRQLRDAERGIRPSDGTLPDKAAEKEIAVHLTPVADRPACRGDDTCTAA